MQTVDKQCRSCNEVVDKEEWNADAEECRQCHTANDYALDECGCEDCLDNAISAVDFND